MNTNRMQEKLGPCPVCFDVIKPCRCEVERLAIEKTKAACIDVIKNAPSIWYIDMQRKYFIEAIEKVKF